MGIPRRSPHLGRSMAIAGALALASLAACFADLDGFSGGAPGAGDGGGDADPSAPADGSSDSSTPPPADGGAGDADARAASFCADAGKHTVCDDHDTDASPGWTGVLTSTDIKGTRKVDFATFVTPPASLSLAFPPLGATEGAYDVDYLSLPLGAKTVHVEADVRPCVPGPGGYVVLFTTNSFDANEEYGSVDVGVHGLDGGAGAETYVSINLDGTKILSPAGPALPADRFSHLTYDLTLDGSAGSVKIAVDGAVRRELTSVKTDQSGAITSRAVWVGTYVENGPACTTWTDDAIVDVGP